MKKNALIALSMIMLSVFSMTFTSCGDDDDDDPVLVTPKYAENAVRYEISGRSEFAAIEFTEGGTYVITKAEESSKAKGWENIFKNKTFNSLTRSISDADMYIHGKYTKNGDVYTLEGFGTITVEKDGDVNVSLKIQPTGKEAYTLSAQPVKKYEDSNINNKLCRTWKFENGRLVVSKGDSVVVDKTSTQLSVLSTTLDSVYHESPDNYYDVEEAIFTKSGTYMVKYSDKTVAVAQWKWKDENKGTVYFAWDYGKFGEKSVFEVSFDKNNDLVMDEEYENTYKGEKYTEHSTYHLSKTE